MNNLWAGVKYTVVSKTDVDLTLTGHRFYGKADTEQVKHINMSLQIIICAKKENEQDAVGRRKEEANFTFCSQGRTPWRGDI